ncbi:hypothetical protein J4410_06135 [Candidatus Woesearchaeota archaeon]|nr:hypothetical protein [Candidatus Woesearchaeota archaeon]
MIDEKLTELMRDYFISSFSFPEVLDDTSARILCERALVLVYTFSRNEDFQRIRPCSKRAIFTRFSFADTSYTIGASYDLVGDGEYPTFFSGLVFLGSDFDTNERGHRWGAYASEDFQRSPSSLRYVFVKPRQITPHLQSVPCDIPSDSEFHSFVLKDRVEKVLASFGKESFYFLFH